MEIDHIVLAAADLEAAKQEFAEATGVMPADGGPHPGGGTRNALVSFGDGCYLEIIAPDPGQELAGTNGQRFAALPALELLHWAVRSEDLNAVSARLSAGGLTPGPVRDMARVAPGGDKLEWQLMGVRSQELGGLMPFFIDWQNTPHPSLAAPFVGSLQALRLGLSAESRHAVFVREFLVGLVESKNEPGLAMSFDSPTGVRVYEAVQPKGFGF